MRNAVNGVAHQVGKDVSSTMFVDNDASCDIAFLTGLNGPLPQFL